MYVSRCICVYTYIYYATCKCQRYDRFANWTQAIHRSPLRIAHLDFVVYIRMQWRPKRTASECSTAPCIALPGIFLTLMGLPPGYVAMRQCSPGQTMEATNNPHVLKAASVNTCMPCTPCTRQLCTGHARHASTVQVNSCTCTSGHVRMSTHVQVYVYT